MIPAFRSCQLAVNHVASNLVRTCLADQSLPEPGKHDPLVLCTVSELRPMALFRSFSYCKGYGYQNMWFRSRLEVADATSGTLSLVAFQAVCCYLRCHGCLIRSCMKLGLRPKNSHAAHLSL